MRLCSFELQGLFLCFLLLDRIGRRLTITYMFLATAACVGLIPVLWAANSCAAHATTATTAATATTTPAATPAAANDAAATPPSLDCPLSPLLDWLQSFLLFVARACSLAFNQSLWIYATEAYPASVRSSGLGVTTLFARVGGALSPWACQWLFWRSRHLSVAACVLAALAAANIAANMPTDTIGSDMRVRMKTVSSNSNSTSSRSTSSRSSDQAGKEETVTERSEKRQLHAVALAQVPAPAAAAASAATIAGLDFALSAPQSHPYSAVVAPPPFRGQAADNSPLSPPPPQLNLDLLRAAVNDDDDAADRTARL